MSIPFTCTEKERLVAVLYDEGDPDERAAVEAHIASCPACADDLAGFHDLRRDLRAWEPPDADLRFRVVRNHTEPGGGLWDRFPAWMPAAAAAVLVVGAAAGLANVRVGHGPDGWHVRTGWFQAASRSVDAVPAPPVAPVVPATSGISEQEFRGALEALEARLRADLEQAPIARASAPAGAAEGDRGEMLRQVRKLIEESERRQQRELALRLTQVVQDFDAQRRADLVRIEQGFGQLEGITGEEAARQRALLNYLVRTSQRQ